MKTKTRMIIAVTNELAAAPQSDAKDDLIEELSENLYQRYTDLVEEGVSEEEARKLVEEARTENQQPELSFGGGA